MIVGLALVVGILGGFALGVAFCYRGVKRRDDLAEKWKHAYVNQLHESRRARFAQRRVVPVFEDTVEHLIGPTVEVED